MAYKVKLLEATDTSGEYKTWNINTNQAILVVSGTFDGASVTFQYQDDNENDLDVYDDADTQLSIDGTGSLSRLVKLFYGEKVKAIITGAGASTELTAILYDVRD